MQEFLQRRCHLEKQQQKIESKNISAKAKKSFSKLESNFSDNNHQDLRLDLQKAALKNTQDTEIELNYLQNESQLLSTDDENPEIKNSEFISQNEKFNSDFLNSSVHQGSHNGFLFEKMLKTKKQVESIVNNGDNYGFLPILSSKINDNKDETEQIPIENITTLTPRGSNPVLNPKAIRVNGSSSLDGSLSSLSTKKTFKNNSQSTSQSLQENLGSARSSNSYSSETNNNITPSNVKMSKGLIWNEPKVQQNILSTSAEITRINVPYEINQSISESLDIQSKSKTKNRLVEAHEHQLSDITETCKKEMNLLSSLKGSQMDLDEYLNQLESMLSKKAHSIRDLQSQITHMKTFHEEHSIP